MNAAPGLVVLLYSNLARPLTPDLVAEILMAAERRAVIRQLPASAEFGTAVYDGMESGPIVYQVERMVDVLAEIKALHANHWDETEMYRAEVGFDPDYAQYIAIDRAGGFLLVTARQAGVMVGYFMIVLHVSRHSSKLVAAEDAFYLKPTHRRGFALLKMLRFTEDCCRRVEAKQITLSEKLTHLIGPVLTRAEFTHCGNLWTKVL